MKKKSSGLAGPLFGLLVLLGFIAQLIKDHWPVILLVGGLGLLVWLYKQYSDKKATDPSVNPRTATEPPAGTAALGWDPNPRLTVTGASGAGRAGRRVRLSREADAFWLSQGAPAKVAGHTIEGGLLYVGTDLAAVNSDEVEAALLDPSLPVARAAADYTVRQLPYWPSYATASPGARAAYLRWLATGRSDPQADLGYVFLYFYGLERRALVDAEHSATARAELPVIEREVERLLGIYGHNGSFRSYAGSLLGFLKAREAPARLYEQPPPPLNARGELTFAHRLALAQCAADGKPLPAEWAYAWLLGDPTTGLRAAAKRCPEEFRRAFAERYAQAFGAGLKLPVNKTKLKATHHAASPSFAPHMHLEKSFDLPDVTVLSSPVKKLQSIAEACYSELDAYSRYVGRNPDRAGSMDALLELPVGLWPEQYRKHLLQVRETLIKTDRPLALPFEKLRSWFPAWGEVTRQKYGSLARVLGEAGLGIEPDIRFAGKLPDGGTTVVLFAEEANDAVKAPSAEYAAAALTLHLAVAVSVADGEADAAERELLMRQLEDWLHLGGSAKRRLHAHLRLLLAEPPGLANIKKRIEALEAPAREAIGDFLARVAQADNQVTPEEIKLLERIFKLLGLDARSLYGRVHGAASEPVTVRPPASVPGTAFTIPKPAPAQPAGSGVRLDMAKVATLHADSEKVSAILGAIFTEEAARDEPPVAERPAAEEEIAAPAHEAILGLDAAHSALVRLLCTRPQWSRAELEELAADRGMMLDGALEHINEAAFDTCDQPLTEGEDPIEINQEIIKEVMQ